MQFVCTGVYWWGILVWTSSIPSQVQHKLHMNMDWQYIRKSNLCILSVESRTCLHVCQRGQSAYMYVVLLCCSCVDIFGACATWQRLAKWVKGYALQCFHWWGGSLACFAGSDNAGTGGYWCISEGTYWCALLVRGTLPRVLVRGILGVDLLGGQWCVLGNN